MFELWILCVAMIFRRLGIETGNREVFFVGAAAGVNSKIEQEFSFCLLIFGTLNA